MKCPKTDCGFENPKEAKYCGKCGNIISQQNNIDPKRERNGYIISQQNNIDPKRKRFKYAIGIVVVVMSILILMWWISAQGFHNSDNFPYYPTPTVTTYYPTPTVSTLTITIPENKKTMGVGDTWNVGSWRLVSNAIDAKVSPRQAWLTLYDRYGTKVDDKVVYEGEIYIYDGFSVEINAIFVGANSDMIQFTNTSIPLSVGDALDVGNGWKLYIGAINLSSDVNSHSRVLLTLYDQYGTKVEDTAVLDGETWDYKNMFSIMIKAILSSSETGTKDTIIITNSMK